MVTLEEYLNTSYEGAEREYVDAKVVERNTGLRDHSIAMGNLIGFLGSRERAFRTPPFLAIEVLANPDLEMPVEQAFD